MNKLEFKYKINYQVSQLPRELAIGDIVSLLEKYGISKDQFYRDRKILIKSSTSITTDRLMIYAKIFDCSINELLNTQVQNVKSIRSHLKPPKSKFNSGLS